MSTPSADAVSETKQWIGWSLGVATAVAILVVAVFSWIDSQKVPVITFLATPQVHIGVDIRGAVSTPGVVTVRPGDRLIDVVNLAGGLAPNADRSQINLSKRVTDGEMIVLPTQAPPGEPYEAGKVNINTASAAELTRLPGIGDVLAGRIVAYRDENGPYRSVDDLAKVEGISQSTVEDLRPLVRITEDD